MPRAEDIPPCPMKPIPPSAKSHVYVIELITPMFGGGVSTRVNDPSFPIRPTSIRGQLQFWWRATVGAQYATRQELRAAQSAVWGDTTRASRVQVRVANVQAAEPKPCALIEWDQKARRGQGGWRTNWQAPFNGHDSALPYALFPFQGETPPPNRSETVTMPPACCIYKANFWLTVTSHKDIDFAKQVEPALWAWVNFGGLGSRTRRGCGAIVCKALAPKDKDDLTAMWLRYMPTLFPLREWPTMSESVLHEKEQPGAISAWDRVIDLFRHFRQGDGNKHYENDDARKRDPLGRNPGHQDPQNKRKKPKPRRSRYPEPETIRTILYNPQAPWQHDRIEHIPNDAFPRAELGLPIVFHFQGQGEPPDTVLYPDNDSEGKKRERMASPLILKPLALQSGKAVPLILRLQTPALMGVDLRIKKKDLSSLRRVLADQVRSTMQPNDNEGSLPLPDSTRLHDPSLSSYPNSPLILKQFAKPEDREKEVETGSAIDAFLAFARTEGFTEVMR